MVEYNDMRSFVKCEKILKPSFDGMYFRVTLHKRHKQNYARIHKLVAEAFLPNPNNYEYVNHKDLNKLNNNIDNLEWCTQLHNMRDAVEKGAFDKVMQPVKVNETGMTYQSISECARVLNVDAKNISACLCGKRKSAGGYHFERAED